MRYFRQNRLLFAIIVILAVGGAYILASKWIGPNTPPENYPTNLSSKTISTVNQTQPSPECSGIPTLSQTEGPYYKTGSPERKNIAEETPGEKLIVTGFVFNKNCKPIENGWLDFWHADASGVYDNTGYKLRGHQYTDDNGQYQLETIVPAAYETRPPHIHVKVRAGNGPTLTSQLYFPDSLQNKTDSIFNDALIMKLSEGQNGKIGEFNFTLNQ